MTFLPSPSSSSPTSDLTAAEIVTAVRKQAQAEELDVTNTAAARAPDSIPPECLVCGARSFFTATLLHSLAW